MRYLRGTLLIAFGLGWIGAPGTVAAQETGECSEDEFVVADYGFSGFECNCSFSVFADGRRRWSFRTEPLVRGIRSGGPSDGISRYACQRVRASRVAHAPIVCGVS